MADRDILIDVSRLIWRLWRGGLPTGIDRVCLAYAEHFRGRAQAVLHRRGRFYVLSLADSDLLFDLMMNRRPFARAFVQFAVRAFPRARGTPARQGSLYLNLGHTGLDEPLLPRWIERNRLRAVFLVHDLIPLTHPEYCRAGEEAKHRRRMQNVLASAGGLIANSRATLEDVRSFAATNGLPMPPSVVAWIAGDCVRTNVIPRSFGRPHFVIVGTIEGRKNHRLLLHIWQRLAGRHGAETPLLVIVGQRGWEAGTAIAMLDRAKELKAHVIELGSCGDQELADIIAGARALLMPSFAEGFGLPVAEALQLGTPVIASNLEVFREFAGDIPTYIDPLDGSAWEDAIVSFAAGSPERQRQKQALVGYRGPDWPSHFKVVEEWLATTF